MPRRIGPTQCGLDPGLLPQPTGAGSVCGLRTRRQPVAHRPNRNRCAPIAVAGSGRPIGADRQPRPRPGLDNWRPAGAGPGRRNKSRDDPAGTAPAVFSAERVPAGILRGPARRRAGGDPGPGDHPLAEPASGRGIRRPGPVGTDEPATRRECRAAPLDDEDRSLSPHPRSRPGRAGFPHAVPVPFTTAAGTHPGKPPLPA